MGRCSYQYRRNSGRPTLLSRRAEFDCQIPDTQSAPADHDSDRQPCMMRRLRLSNDGHGLKAIGDKSECRGQMVPRAIGRVRMGARR